MSIREANNNRVLQLGNTNAKRTKNSFIALINREFSSSPSYHEVYFNGSNTIREVQITDENAITKNPNKKRVLCKPSENINIGDDILWNSVHWLCTNVDSDKEIYAKGIIERCNNTLTFQLPNGTTKQYPCISGDKSSTYSDGTINNKYLTLAEDQILITIQNNSDTTQLDYDKRFIFKHDKNEIYKLTKIQGLHKEGVLDLTMTKNLYNETNDNLELNLADYVANNFVVTILNGDTVSLNTSQTLQLSCEVRNNGVLVSNPTITYVSSDITKATISTTGLITPLLAGTITITVTSNGATDSISVTIEEVISDNYSIEFINPSTFIYQGQSKTFNIKLMNNGVQVTEDVLFTVNDNTLAIITSQTDTNVVVKANSTKLGTVVLKCELVEDSLVYKESSIIVKSII